MAEARFIRRISFRATHRYWRTDWPDERNRAVFGPQCDPHEHHWLVEARIVGPIDPDTGFSADLTAVDAALGELFAGCDGGDLNRCLSQVPVPTTEALARWCFESLGARVPAPARLERVAVFESEDLGAEYPAGAAR